MQMYGGQATNGKAKIMEYVITRRQMRELIRKQVKACVFEAQVQVFVNGFFPRLALAWRVPQHPCRRWLGFAVSGRRTTAYRKPTEEELTEARIWCSLLVEEQFHHIEEMSHGNE